MGRSDPLSPAAAEFALTQRCGWPGARREIGQAGSADPRQRGDAAIRSCRVSTSGAAAIAGAVVRGFTDEASRAFSATRTMIDFTKLPPNLGRVFS